MADNYLEKQYESYLARKAAWEKAKKLGKAKKYSPKPVKRDGADTDCTDNEADERTSK